MKIRTFTALVVAGLLLTSHAVLAQPGSRGMRGDGPGARWEHMAQVLDLSEDQVAAIDQIREDARTQHLDLRKQMLRLRNEMKGEMLKDDPDQATLDELVDQIGELKAQLQKDRLATQLAIRKELTPEQRDRWLTMREQGPREGRGGRGGRGDGACMGHGRRGPRCHG